MTERAQRLRTWALIALAHDTFWLEVCLAAVACAWANTLWLMSGDLAERTAYAAVARFASDDQWEAMGCVGALVQVIAAFRHERMTRFLAAVLMAGFWLVLADGVLAAGPRFTPTVVPYYALAAFNLVCAALPVIRRLRWLRG